jgi:hypothetical protein
VLGREPGSDRSGQERNVVSKIEECVGRQTLTDLTERTVRRRPAGVGDDVVAAVGKLSEALEWVERARGRLYDLHQMIGRADFLFEEAADELDAAGHSRWADVVRHEVVGRNVLEGRWTFQVVEEFDALYWDCVRQVEAAVRDDVLDGARHIFEAELKEARRSHGRRFHEARPLELRPDEHDRPPGEHALRPPR